MSKNKWIGVAFVSVVLFGVGVFVYFGTDVIRSGDCGEPPQAIATTNLDVDAALSESIAFIKYKQDVKVLERISKGARNAQVTGYLVCLAKEKGIVKTPEEIRNYTQLMALLSRDPTPEQILEFRKSTQPAPPVQTGVDHEGFFVAIRKKILKDVPPNEFEMTIQGGRKDELDRLWIESTGAPSWGPFFTKVCRANSGCLKCTPPAGKIEKSVTVELVGSLAEGTTAEGVKKFTCAK